MSRCNVSEAGLIGCDELFMPRLEEANAGVSSTRESRLALLTHMQLWVADGLPGGAAYAQSVVETLSECPLNHSLRKVSRERTF